MIFSLAVALADDASFWETVLYELIGFGVVMGALATLWGVFTLTGNVFRNLQSKAKIEPEPQVSPPVEADALTPQLETVIAAAVAAIVGGPHRIVSMRASESRPTSAWALEGRARHMGSHRVR